MLTWELLHICKRTENDTVFNGIDFRIAFRLNIIKQNQRLNMKPAFILICMLGGVQEKYSTMYLSSINNCKYFSDFMTNQSMEYKNQDGRMETRKYQCICKLTKVPNETRLY